MRVLCEDRGRGGRHCITKHVRRHRRPCDGVVDVTASSGWLVYTAVAVVAVLCYLNGTGGDFVHDDIPAVMHNKDVLGVTPLTDVFGNDFWGMPMSDVNSHKSYRPLTTLTFRANYQLGGMAPLNFHACNVLLHAAASMLFTRVCVTVAGLQPSFAGLAGLLFAAHPVHTEAVTGIVGRADVLASVFFLLSFLAYHGHREDAGQMPVWVSVGLGAVSMLAKETGFTVMLVNLAYDFYKSWPSIRRSFAEVRWNNDTLHFSRRTSKVLMSLSVLLVFRLALLQGSLPKFSNQDNPASFHPYRHVRFLTFCYLSALNCWLLICPATLSHDWQMGSVPLITSLADVRNLASCIFLGCCLLIAYKGIADLEHQRHPPLVLGALLLALPFLPASNLMVTVGFVVAERVLYIPSLGFLLLVAYGAQQTWAVFARRRSLLLMAGVVLLLGFAARTLARNRDWASREALIRAGLKALPHNAKMHYNFANFLRDSSHLELATNHYQEALRLWPTYASAHNNLGTLMTGAEEAEKHFLSAIRFSPDHVNAHYNLGQVYRKVNRTAEAIALLKRCITLDSTYTPAYLLLARLHADRKSVEDRAQVGRLLHHVTRLQPRNPDNLAEYAEWLTNQRRTWEALDYYMRALLVSVTHKTSLLEAAKILRAKGQWPRIHQIVTRSRIMSRQRRGGVVFTGDLYIRSWELETESLYRKYDVETASKHHRAEPNKKSYIKIKSSPSDDADGDGDGDADADADDHEASPRVKSWRRLAVNRSAATKTGTNAATETNCNTDTTSGLPVVADVGSTSGTAAFNQAYDYQRWAQEAEWLPSDAPVSLYVEAPSIAAIGAHEKMFPDAYVEDEFVAEVRSG